jgi:hypothetical protein
MLFKQHCLSYVTHWAYGCAYALLHFRHCWYAAMAVGERTNNLPGCFNQVFAGTPCAVQPCIPAKALTLHIFTFPPLLVCGPGWERGVPTIIRHWAYGCAYALLHCRLCLLHLEKE